MLIILGCCFRSGFAAVVIGGVRSRIRGVRSRFVVYRLFLFGWSSCKVGLLVSRYRCGNVLICRGVIFIHHDIVTGFCTGRDRLCYCLFCSVCIGVGIRPCHIGDDRGSAVDFGVGNCNLKFRMIAEFILYQECVGTNVNKGKFHLICGKNITLIINRRDTVVNDIVIRKVSRLSVCLCEADNCRQRILGRSNYCLENRFFTEDVGNTYRFRFIVSVLVNKRNINRSALIESNNGFIVVYGNVVCCKFRIGIDFHLSKRDIRLIEVNLNTNFAACLDILRHRVLDICNTG